MRIHAAAVALLVLVAGVTVPPGAHAQASASAPAQASASAPASRPLRSDLEIRISPLVDLHYYVRARAGTAVSETAPPEFAAAVAAARELDSALGSFLAWGLIEGNLEDCSSAGELARRFADLPEQHRMRDGRTIALRGPAVRLAEAYAQVEPEFLRTVWPAHQAALEQARAKLNADFLPQAADCLAYMLDRLNMADPHIRIPAYLVADAPPPGAVTHRTRAGGGICFISIQEDTPALLAETLLHEAAHALDLATSAGGSVLVDLRRQLAERGFPPDSPGGRDVPHTLMFVQAGETVRRRLDPAHQHYGDVCGYYRKVPQATAAVRETWVSYLDGKIAREDAVRRIVGEVVRQSQK